MNITTVLVAMLTLCCLSGCTGDSGNTSSNPADNPSSTVPGVVKVIGMQGTEAGEFYSPESIATDKAGNIYVVDSFNNRIQKLAPTGSPILSWGSEGTGNGQFEGCRGIAVDSIGNIYVTDVLLHRVQKFDPSGNFIGAWGSEGTGDGEFSSPFDIAVDAADNVYVVDSGNNRVQKFSPAGAFIATFGSTGTADGQFDEPVGIAIDQHNMIYITDGNNDRIQKFDANFNFIATWGTTGTSNGQFNLPYGLSAGPTGDIYVTDIGNNRIQKFDSSGNFLGSAGTRGDQDGQFYEPSDIALDHYGNLYVVDESNHRLQLLTQDIFSAPAPKVNFRSTAAITTTGVNTASWMRDLANNPLYGVGMAPLTLLAIPGTHDSGTYSINVLSDMANDGNVNGPQEVTNTTDDVSHWCHKTWWTPHKLCVAIDKVIKDDINPIGTAIAKSVQAPWSKSQDQSILQQLRGGIRFLDLRIQSHKNGFYVVHSMVGENIEKVLDDIVTFCSQPESSEEVILVALRNYQMDSALDKDLIDLVETKLRNSQGQSLLIPRAASPSGIRLSNIKNSPGRVIVFYADNDWSSYSAAMLNDHPDIWYKNNSDHNTLDGNESDGLYHQNSLSTLVNFWPDTTSNNDLLTTLPAKRKEFLSTYGTEMVLPPMNGLKYKDVFYVSQLLRTQGGNAIKQGIESEIFAAMTDDVGAALRYLFKKLWHAAGLSTAKPGNLLDWGTDTNKSMPQYFTTMNDISFANANKATAHRYMLNIVIVDNYKSAPVDFVDEIISYNIRRHPL